MKHIYFLILVFIGHSFFAQEEEKLDIPNLTLPSPSAYHLGKYGQNNIGLFSGTSQVSIPVFEFRSGKINIPIGLNYSSNGLKVNQVTTNVGLGWTLNSGGVISRIARDESDEFRNYFFPEEDLEEAGTRSPLALDFYKLGSENEIDTETDIFSFNFLNFSGKFFIDNNRKIIQVPKTNLMIEAYVDGLETGFKITTPDGVSYFFEYKEETISRVSGGGHSIPELPITTAWYLSKIIHPAGDEIYFDYVDSNYSYTASESQTLRVANPSGQYTCSGTPVSGYSVIPAASQGPLATNLTHVGKRLVKIYSNKPSAGFVEFQSTKWRPNINMPLETDILLKNSNNSIISSAHLEYLTTNNDRIFLESLTYKNSQKRYSFEYIQPELFPQRLSYSQDHWGYFNGKSNSYLFPNPQTLTFSHAALSNIDFGANKEPDPLYAEIGMLTKVIYPTKGSSEISYEPNTYRGTKIIDPLMTSESLSINTEEFEMGTYTDTKSIYTEVNQWVTINLSAYFNDSACESSRDAGKSKATFQIKDQATGNYIGLYKESDLGRNYMGTGFSVGPDNFDEITANLESNKSYSIELSVTFECVRAGATVHFMQGSGSTEESNIIAGGLRVKSLKNLDENGLLANYKRYHYSAKDNLGNSSGVKGAEPFYLNNIIQRTSCQPDNVGYEDIHYLHLESNSLRKLFDTQGINSTTYQYVTESLGGNNFEQGGIEYVFQVSSDTKAKSIWGDLINGAPFTNTGWKNGYELEKNIFKTNENNQIQLLESTQNSYVADLRDYDEIKGYVIRKNFELTSYGDVTYDCKEEDLNKVYMERYCSVDHKHEYFAIPWRDGWTCVTGNMEERAIPHPCYGKTTDSIIVYSNFLENLDVMEYKTLSHWYYMDSKEVTEYDNLGNPMSTNLYTYEYNNPEHKILSVEGVTNSKNGQIINKFYYPGDIEASSDLTNGDLSPSQLDILFDMKSPNIYLISYPVQEENINKTLEGTILSKSVKRNNYKIKNGIALVDKVLTAKSADSLEERVVYNRYDDAGNPLELYKSNGAHTVYIWGYEDQFPIAKIENSTYLEVATNLDETVSTLESNVNENNLSEINTLRTKLPNALITTYSYEPLIGLKTITDPRGKTTSYDYDEFGRLREVKDSDNYLLKEYKYNYKSN